MAQEWTPTTVPGVLRRSSSVHADDRGAFTELWRQSWTTGLTAQPFVQCNLSRSRPTVLRGMHFHRRQSDLWVVLEGRALVAVADLRGMLDRGGRRPAVETFELTAGDSVFVPELVAHGFYAPEAMAMVYLVTNEFDGSDELGFAWDDPDSAIPWATREVILSNRDRANPSLRVALASLRAEGA